MATAPDPLLQILRLYHFTDVRNLPMIKKLDGLWSTAKLKKGRCEFFAGGNDWSLEQDARVGMDYYVHLCWDAGHPMEWYIKQRNKDINLIYLEIDRVILYEPGVVFSSGVSNASGMVTHSVQEAVDGGMIDYDAINRNIGSFYHAENQARRSRAEKSEILVPERVPMKFIKNFPNG
jgi:hypothetical protein